MKKKYIKPMLAVEYYELTQSIAACVTKIGFLNSECVLNDPDATQQMKFYALLNWFTDKNCEYSAIGMDGNDSICYHTNANAAFNS